MVTNYDYFTFLLHRLSRLLELAVLGSSDSLEKLGWGVYSSEMLKLLKEISMNSEKSFTIALFSESSAEIDVGVRFTLNFRLLVESILGITGLVPAL